MSNRHTPARARKVERRYGQQLRQIASHIDTIVRGFDVEDDTVYPSIVTALRRYADSLHDWAISAAGRVLADIAQRDEQTWMTYSQEMSKALRDEIRTAPTGMVMRQLLADQVKLIRSLPLDAAQRVHDLAQDAVQDGRRTDEIVQMILQSGQVSKARANVIARTEVSRAASTLTQARAQHIGSEGYIWRESGINTRPSHHRMNGTFVRWDSPPTLDRLTGHAGCLPNCQCYPEPVIPDD